MGSAVSFRGSPINKKESLDKETEDDKKAKRVAAS
jgi:hypothetical protein